MKIKGGKGHTKIKNEEDNKKRPRSRKRPPPSDLTEEEKKRALLYRKGGLNTLNGHRFGPNGRLLGRPPRSKKMNSLSEHKENGNNNGEQAKAAGQPKEAVRLKRAGQYGP